MLRLDYYEHLDAHTHECIDQMECWICNPTPLHTDDVALPFRYTHLIGQFIACDYITDRYGNGILDVSDNLEDLIDKHDDNVDVWFYYVGNEGIVYAPVFG